jgi:hypothetical protein
MKFFWKNVMKRATPAPPFHVISRHWTFFCAMLGFLMIPFMPVQFTSILTAVVWIFSGIQYALLFTFLGTFRFDSIPIFTGIQNILRAVAPSSFLPFSEPITILFMFLGNLATAYIIKRVFVAKLVSRIHPVA